MKGDSKFFIKGIYLILVILIIVLVTNRIVSLNVSSSEEAENLKFVQRASTILETLTSSPNCLAYEEQGRIESYQLKLSTHKIIDKEKLDKFQEKYQDVEPDCYLDSEYGYRIQVSTFPINIETSNEMPETKNTIAVSLDQYTWEFGSLVFSINEALEKSIKLSIPVVVRFDQSIYLPGTMKITLVKGDLEKIKGFIEKSCYVDALSTNIHLHYPVYLKTENGANYICMKFETSDRCQKLNCKKQIIFDEINSAGNYIFYSATDNNIVRIST